MISMALGLVLITVVEGDANCDGNVDFADIGPFVTALSGGAVAWAETTSCPVETYLCVCDLNGDGVVDFRDIDPFIALLFSGGHIFRDCGPAGLTRGAAAQPGAQAHAPNVVSRFGLR